MSETPKVITNLEEEVSKQPWYVWAGAMTGAGIIFFYVMKSRAAKAAATQTATVPTSSSANPTNADINGMQLADMAGLPYGMEGYTSNSGNPVDNYPVTSSTTGTTTTTPTPGSTTEGALVRARFNSDTTKAYDTKFAQGVPIHAAASSSSQVVGYAQYASQVKITGSPVGGTSNFGTGNTKGSGLWFPVANGFISGYDLVGFFTLPAMGGGGASLMSEFQEFLNAGRNTIDQYVALFNLGA